MISICLAELLKNIQFFVGLVLLYAASNRISREQKFYLCRPADQFEIDWCLRQIEWNILMVISHYMVVEKIESERVSECVLLPFIANRNYFLECCNPCYYFISFTLCVRRIALARPCPYCLSVCFQRSLLSYTLHRQPVCSVEVEWGRQRERA